MAILLNLVKCLLLHLRCISLTRTFRYMLSYVHFTPGNEYTILFLLMSMRASVHVCNIYY